MMVPVRRYSIALFLIAALTQGTWASACSIPVFRYALERWSSDLYELDIFYSGTLSADDQKRVDALEGLAFVNGGSANLEVVRCDLAGKLPNDLRQLWESLDKPVVPHAVVRAPHGRNGSAVLWSGPLVDLDPRAVAESSARAELARRLLAGDAVVWLVLADAKQNHAAGQRARQLLDDQLPKLAEDIPLPPGIGQDDSRLMAPIPLLVKFSVLPVDVADPAEDWLARVLKSLAPKEYQSGEPLVAAVFGRGRVVQVFRAAELDEQLVSDVSYFLCGACSCQVKDGNPGFDLLTSIPWEERLFAASGQPIGSSDPAADTQPLAERPNSASDRLPPVPRIEARPDASPPTPQSATAIGASAAVPPSGMPAWYQAIPYAIAALCLTAVAGLAVLFRRK